MPSSLEEHYGQLLGLNDQWSVSDVELDMGAQRVSIVVEFTGDHYGCPECQSDCRIYDRRGSSRKWRHLDTMQFETLIESEIPRIQCKDHGVKSIEMPWAGKHSRFTLLFEAFAIKVLQAGRSVEESRKLLKLNWHQMEQIKKRAVERGLSRRRQTKIRHIGIDEKAHRKGHRYVTLVNDLEAGRVLDVVEERTEQACQTVLDSALSKRQRNWVEAVAIDMWPAYINAVSSKLPDSAIVHDRFHISKHLNEAVDEVRRQEHAQLKAQGDDRLKKTRYLWLSNSVADNREGDFESLKEGHLKVARAWSIKEMFREFWGYRAAGWAKRHFDAWYSWASRSRLEPIKKVAKMIKEHIDNILTWFAHPISNGVSEGLNSKIQTVKSNARGYRSFESFRISILFYCGKLDMAP